MSFSGQKITLLAVLAVLCASLSVFAQVSVDTIIKRSVEANKLDWKLEPDFTHFERDKENGQDKTYEVMMIDGSPYQRLVAVNGKPLSEQEQRSEEQKLRQTISQRHHESPRQRAQRIANYEKDRKRDNLLMEQLTGAFNFSLVAEEKLGLHDVYVLQATPRPGYRPPNNEAKVLTGMQGRLWVDKQSFQWVKVEAEVIHPVSIEGFLARVSPGTRFELEKEPVDNNVWLPKHFAMKANAKIVFLINHNSQEDDTFWGYRRNGSPPPGTEQSFNNGSNRSHR
jgi:hypothetical protein